MTEPASLSNHFLIAMPSLVDPMFGKSVIYVHEHGPDGTIGVLINKPLQIHLGNLFEHLGVADSADKKLSKKSVFMGGPVGQEHGFILYEDTVAEGEVPELLLSVSKDMLIDIAEGRGPKHFLVALGYAGWSAGQLEEEIQRNDWLIARAEPSLVFQTPVSQRWSSAGKLLGVDMARLSGQCGHA